MNGTRVYVTFFVYNYVINKRNLGASFLDAVFVRISFDSFGNSETADMF